MRGLAIIGIFLHNYCHWLGFAVKENEYTFTMSKSSSLMQAISDPDWNLPIHLISFFGHYGVPVFLFLSAYGLVMKYEKRGGLAKKQTDVVPEAPLPEALQDDDRGLRGVHYGRCYHAWGA